MPALFPELPEIAEAVVEPTATDYAVAAKYALKRKQRPLAVQQISAALAIDPQNDRYLQLLSDIVGTTPDPLALLRIRAEGTFYGLAAARAWMLAKQRRATEGTELLSDVLQFRPNVPFAPWLDEWQQRFDWTRRVEPEVVIGLLRGLVAQLLTDGVQAGGDDNLNAVLRATAALQAVHPKHGPLRAARMWAHRQLGEEAIALELASSGPIAWETELERARCLRNLRKPAEEVQALQSALRQAPDQPALFLELACAWVRLRRRDEAATVLLQAKAGAPSAAGAAALAYLEWLADDGRSPLTTLDDEVSAGFIRDTQCYRELLPDPRDAAVSIVRGALAHAAGPEAPSLIQVRAALAHRSAPSAALAFELGLGSLGKRGQLTLNGESTPSALGELWSFNQGSFVPALPPPQASSVAAVARLASTRFEWLGWLRAAQLIAAEALVTTAPLDLVSVALHPPAAPPTADAVQWLTHVHVALGVLLGVMNGGQEPGLAIARCLAANDDWICSAGVVAVYAAVAAEHEPLDAARDKLAKVLKVIDARSGGARTLAIVGSLLGGAHVEEFRDLRAQLAFEGWAARRR